MQTFRPVIRWWTVIYPRLIAHFTESLEVHADRLVYKRGVFNKSEDVILFTRVTNYSAHQNFFDRIFSTADFQVETAAAGVTPELTLRGYSYKLRDILAQALERGRS